MAADEGSAQGAGQEQGSEGKDQTKGEDEFDKDRALATIKTQREAEKALKADLKKATTERDALVAKNKAEADAKLSEQEQASKRLADLEAQLKETSTKAQVRVGKSALKSAAAAAGAIYPDDMPAIVGTDALEFDDDGEPTNATALVEELKKSRPALFGTPKAGSFDGGARGTTGGGKQDMESLLRGAAGR